MRTLIMKKMMSDKNSPEIFLKKFGRKACNLIFALPTKKGSLAQLV